jgi:uncharacterized protein YraI
MRKSVIITCLALLIALGGMILFQGPAAQAFRLQIPTGSVPTVTGTPVNAIAVVMQNEQGFANVRSGPGAKGYEIVGVLVIGQQIPALGRSPGGDWIQVAYPGAPGGIGWVYKDLIEVRGSLPVVQAPPTPTPRTTPTIDPTLAAQFLVDLPSTRQPTYTPPPPLSIPTFTPDPAQSARARAPMGLVIIVLIALGAFGFLLSLLRGR